MRCIEQQRDAEGLQRRGVERAAALEVGHRRNGEPRIKPPRLRHARPWTPGTHFVSLQRSLEDFNATRAVMNAADAHHHPVIAVRYHNGINAFINVEARATFAAPPAPATHTPTHMCRRGSR